MRRLIKRYPAQLACLIALLGLVGCTEGEPETQHVTEAQPVAVRVETLRPQDHAEVYEAVGTVRARNAAEISSRIISYIRAVHAEEGDLVREGQVLVELDDEDLLSNLQKAEASKRETQEAIREASHGLASAQAQLELARSTHRRYQNLLEKKSLAQQEYDEVAARLRSAEATVEMTQAKRAQAEAKLAQAEAAISAAKVALGYATVKSPFSGIVTERPMDPGNLATPGMPILKIDQQGSYRLAATVSESRLQGVVVGKKVPVTIEALETAFEARVTEIVPTIDPESRTALVKIALPRRAGLRSGMFGRARFPGPIRRVLIVPGSAVIERGQLQSVFVVEDRTARKRLVSLGAQVNGGYEVLSGLLEGDRVVLNPGSITDGSPVEIQSTSFGLQPIQRQKLLVSPEVHSEELGS